MIRREDAMLVVGYLVILAPTVEIPAIIVAHLLELRLQKALITIMIFTLTGPRGSMIS